MFIFTVIVSIKEKTLTKPFFIVAQSKSLQMRIQLCPTCQDLARYYTKKVFFVSIFSKRKRVVLFCNVSPETQKPFERELLLQYYGKKKVACRVSLSGLRDGCQNSLGLKMASCPDKRRSKAAEKRGEERELGNKLFLLLLLLCHERQKVCVGASRQQVEFSSSDVF